jgi:restriction system protein
MTVCRIARNDAEARCKAILAKTQVSLVESIDEPTEQPQDSLDFESLALDEIANLIMGRFKGHGLQRVVAGILRAQGYTVLITPPGPDKGIDLLASQGPLGFQEPKICVQVKSGEGPADTDTVMKLIGSMKHTGASHGLLVSWGGFKQSVKGDLERKEFFNLRLWGQEDLIRNLLAEYERLDPDLMAELPLKKIWIVARGEV